MENLILGIIVLGVLILLIAQIKKNNLSDKKAFSLELLMERLEEDKQARFRENESLKNELRQTSQQLNDSFHRVNKTVDAKLSDSSEQFSRQFNQSLSLMEGLGKELGKMSEVGRGIENLNKIFKSPHGRGSFGETTLEEILQSIFPHHLWERQFSILGVGVVDAVVKTNQGYLSIDAKFPFSGFEKIQTAENESLKKMAEKEFHRDVEKRINEVAKYIRPEKETLDFAILFVPNENLYYEIAIRNSNLTNYAQSKKVLLSGPNSISYLLQIIFQAYQSQNFAKKAQEALLSLSGIKKESERLGQQVEVMLKHLGNAQMKGLEIQQGNSKLTLQIDSITNKKEREVS